MEEEEVGYLNNTDSHSAVDGAEHIESSYSSDNEDMSTHGTADHMAHGDAHIPDQHLIADEQKQLLLSDPEISFETAGTSTLEVQDIEQTYVKKVAQVKKPESTIRKSFRVRKKAKMAREWRLLHFCM